MKILYVVSRWGEPTETFVRREVAAGRAAGHDIRVLSLKPPHEVPDGPAVMYRSTSRILVEALTAFLRHPARVGRTVKLLRGSSLRNLPRHAFALAVAAAAHRDVERPDWVHAHFAWLSATTAWGLSELLDVPFGIMPHAHDVYEHDLIDGLLRRKLGAANVVVVESERIRVDVRQAHGRDAQVLRMGVPDDFVTVRRTHEGRATRVVSVGALRAKKGHDVLIEAVSELTDVELRVVGEGAERVALEALIAEHDISDRVTLVGHVPEARVVAELDRADVFALASRVTPEGDRDGVPNVLIEAMARGLPVIGTDLAGIPDLLLPDRGSIVDSDDVDALRNALEELVGDANLRNLRSDAAQEHIRENYTILANWRRLEDILTKARTS